MKIGKTFPAAAILVGVEYLSLAASKTIPDITPPKNTSSSALCP